jgi:integrase
MNSRLLVEVAVRNAIDDGLRLFVMLEGIGSKAGEWGSPPRQWQRKLGRLNRYLSMVDYEGRALQFHSNQLRDTFAVEHLLAGTSMQDLSRMLSHKTVRVTEKYYAPAR